MRNARRRCDINNCFKLFLLLLLLLRLLIPLGNVAAYLVHVQRLRLRQHAVQQLDALHVHRGGAARVLLPVANLSTATNNVL